MVPTLPVEVSIFGTTAGFLLAKVDCQQSFGYNRATMAANITLEKAKKNLDAVIKYVDREGDVYIVKNNQIYHLHRELSESEAVAIGKESEKEYRSGKTRSFKQFLESEYPEYA